MSFKLCCCLRSLLLFEVGELCGFDMKAFNSAHSHCDCICLCMCVFKTVKFSLPCFCVSVFVCIYIYVNLKTIKESAENSAAVALSVGFPQLFDGWLDLFLLPSNPHLNTATSNAKDLNLLWDCILLMLNSHCLW